MGISHLRRLADHLLPEGIDTFIREERAAGRSWRVAAIDLGKRTEWAIDVTHETLRSWYPGDEAEPAA